MKTETRMKLEAEVIEYRKRDMTYIEIARKCNLKNQWVVKAS
jgi:hypothetical protein